MAMRPGSGSPVPGPRDSAIGAGYLSVIRRNGQDVQADSYERSDPVAATSWRNDRLLSKK